MFVEKSYYYGFACYAFAFAEVRSIHNHTGRNFAGCGEFFTKNS